MILLRLQGGLGNQLFQYACGFSLARRRGDDLRFDLSHYRWFRDRRVELDDLGIMLPEVSAWRQWSSRAFPVGRIGSRLARYQRRLLPAWAHPQRGDESGCTPEVLFREQRQTLLLDGYWQDERFFASHAESLLATIQLPTGPWKRAEGCQAAIHVRRGDYVANPISAAIYGTLNAGYYRRALDRLGTPRRVALVSDDPKWVLANWDLGVELVDCSSASAATDLALMAAAPALVIANSTLSWWGARLGGGHRPVVAPARWLADPNAVTVPSLPAHWCLV